jgi:hypothetical protein
MIYMMSEIFILTSDLPAELILADLVTSSARQKSLRKNQIMAQMVMMPTSSMTRWRRTVHRMINS